MTGSLQEKRKEVKSCLTPKYGYWHVVLDYTDANGKRCRPWINTRLKESENTKRKAQAREKELVAEYEEIINRSPILDLSFLHDFAMYWHQSLEGRIEMSTYEKYENIVAKHIVPYFKEKNMAVAEVRAKHIKDYYTYKMTSGRKDGQKGGLSYETVKNHSSVLNLIFQLAVELEEVHTNPVLSARIPRPKVEDQKERYEDVVFLTTNQANILLNGFNGDFLQPIIYFTLYYGLRRSEVLGLKEDAFDFERDTFEIRHTVVKHKTIVAKDRTKGKKKTKSYDLLPEEKEMVLELFREKAENKKQFGANYKDKDGYIFTWPNGTHIRPDYITNRFKTVLKQRGLPMMRFHDLRHSCASILYDKGWPLKDIQQWLRHAKLQTTMDIYTHISREREKMMAQDMAGTFKLTKIENPAKNKKATNVTG